MGAKMMSRGTKKHKSREKRTLEKTSKTQHCKKWVTACLWGGSAKALFELFFATIPKILEMRRQASKMSLRASKMTKNHDYVLPKSRKSYCRMLVFYTLEKHFWTTCLQKSVEHMNAGLHGFFPTWPRRRLQNC